MCSSYGLVRLWGLTFAAGVVLFLRVGGLGSSAGACGL